jgi:hypothetical protein
MSCLHCSIARHPAGSRLPHGNAGDDRAAPRPVGLRHLWDDAMARATASAQAPFQRYLTVLVTAE